MYYIYIYINMYINRVYYKIKYFNNLNNQIKRIF